MGKEEEEHWVVRDGKGREGEKEGENERESSS